MSLRTGCWEIQKMDLGLGDPRATSLGFEWNGLPLGLSSLVLGN